MMTKRSARRAMTNDTGADHAGETGEGWRGDLRRVLSAWVYILSAAALALALLGWATGHARAVLFHNGTWSGWRETLKRMPRHRMPDGLLSAEFPPMMIQGLVENAIKHGLEPKAEGGKLTVKAEILHGKLAVTVADTGLGFGRAATSGTGVGLANIRERLQLLYGPKASLTITENPGGGTRVTLAVPYIPGSVPGIRFS